MTVNVDQCFAVVDDIILSCGRRRGVSHQCLSPLSVSWFGILADFWDWNSTGLLLARPAGADAKRLQALAGGQVARSFTPRSR
jgi:hypothetical protein